MNPMYSGCWAEIRGPGEPKRAVSPVAGRLGLEVVGMLRRQFKPEPGLGAGNGLAQAPQHRSNERPGGPWSGGGRCLGCRAGAAGPPWGESALGSLPGRAWTDPCVQSLL